MLHVSLHIEEQGCNRGKKSAVEQHGKRKNKWKGLREKQAKLGRQTALELRSCQLLHSGPLAGLNKGRCTAI